MAFVHSESLLSGRKHWLDWISSVRLCQRLLALTLHWQGTIVHKAKPQCNPTIVGLLHLMANFHSNTQACLLWDGILIDFWWLPDLFVSIKWILKTQTELIIFCSGVLCSLSPDAQPSCLNKVLCDCFWKKLTSNMVNYWCCDASVIFLIKY